MRYQDCDEFKNVNGYEINGVWYPRVTKILDIKAKPALDNFLKEVGSYASAEEIKNKSAEEGTLIHEIVQKVSQGADVVIPEHIRPAVSAFGAFYKKRGIVFHPEFIERRIWSPRYSYAGTVDALATIDGKFGVLDIKTSTGFYPEYNLQTAAYVYALREFDIKKELRLPCEIQTRWILRVNQHYACTKCASTLRRKGGRDKIRNKKGGGAACIDSEHLWGPLEGDIELREFPYIQRDMKAFMAAKVLWEWENNYWLRQVGYVK